MSQILGKWRQEDLVDLILCASEYNQRLTQTAAQAGEASFAPVWDSDEDTVYDEICGCSSRKGCSLGSSGGSAERS